MFRFESPIYLSLLAIIPALALIRYTLLYRQHRRLNKYCDPELLKALTPDASKWRPAVKFWLLMTAMALLIVMIARPQLGGKINNEKRTGIETVIAVDVSNSMYAEDVAPNRLERSKMLVENLVDNFTDDKIGLIVFAGDAYVQLPITSDYVSAKLFLSSINPSMIDLQGTDMAQAIRLATHSFTKQEGIGRAIIVITDGEDHEGGVMEAAAEAKEKGMNVYVLGVGSPKGAPIPIPGTNDHMRDNEGNTVMSALNEQMCMEVAQAGGGAYIHVSNNSRAKELLNDELDKLAQKEIAVAVYNEYDEQFQAVCILILLLIIMEACLLDRKNPLFKGMSLFGGRRIAGGKSSGAAMLLVLVAMLFASTSVMAQNDRDYIRQGNSLFHKGDFVKAEEAYHKALAKNKKNPQALYNLGNALMQQQKDSAAVEAFEQAGALDPNPLRKAMSYHNMGVICQGHKMYGEAIEAYKQALRNNPHDDTTRYNLELCKRQKQEQDQQQQGQDQQQEQKDKQDKQDQKDKKDEQKQQEQKQQQQPQKQDKNKMNKETAEQLLKAAQQQEKNTKERMQKAQQQPASRKLQKNW